MKILLRSLFLIFILNICVSAVQAAEISVYVNGEKVKFNDNVPITKNSRIIVPLADIVSSIGAASSWDAKTKTVTIDMNKRSIELSIGKKDIKLIAPLKTEILTADSAPEIINGVTYVPLAVVAESLGGEVKWKADEKAAYISLYSPSSLEMSMVVSGQKLTIGENVSRVAAVLGSKPVSQNQSVYNYAWQKYPLAEKDYFLVGQSEDIVVAFFTNSKKISLAGIYPTMTSEELSKAVGEILPKQVKNILENENGRLTIYRNSLDNYSVMAILLQNTNFTKIDAAINNDFFSKPTEEGLADLLNSERKNRGLASLNRNELLAKVAKGHSENMAVSGILSNTDSNGKNPFDRMKSGNVDSYNMAAESIGRNIMNDIDIYCELMNRKNDMTNVLSKNFSEFGIGVAPSKKENKTYYTINFIDK